MTTEAMEKCKKQIKKHEGLRLEAYKDSLGYWTIGYGHYLGNAATPTPANITQAEADALFERDFAVAYEDAKRLVFGEWDAVGDARQAIVVNMSFNLGFNALKNFKKMVTCLETHEYSKAADEMLNSKWAAQVGKRATELATQMRTGVWQ
ncbi:lysozyme [Campylobacterota bacterium]|nr:lysozyme [Campylobacterota bacterium]